MADTYWHPTFEKWLPKHVQRFQKAIPDYDEQSEILYRAVKINFPSNGFLELYFMDWVPFIVLKNNHFDYTGNSSVQISKETYSFCEVYAKKVE